MIGMIDRLPDAVLRLDADRRIVGGQRGRRPASPAYAVERR